MKMIKARIPWIAQFLRFGLMGAFNTVLALGIYELLVYLNLAPQLSNFVAFIITVVNAFFWNRRWVFERKSIDKQAIFRFFALYLATYMMGAGLLHLWIEILGINKFIAPVFSLFITIPTNFLFSKYWVFKSNS